MTTLATQPGLRWWQGVGSPGLPGYVLADLAAVGVLALLLPMMDAVTGHVGDYVAEVLLVAVYGTYFSIPLALVGIPIVHLCCLRVRHQAVHVLAAGLVGVAVVVLPVAVVSGELAAEGLLLGVATAAGRAAVIPLALARMR